MKKETVYSLLGGIVLGLILSWLWSKISCKDVVYTVPKPSPEATITFTCTTHKRLDQFCKTMISLLKNMKDLHLIRSWVVIDDGSSLEDRITMQRMFPFVTFVGKGEGYRKHPHSMNILLYGFVNTPYWLQFEDDWETKVPFRLSEVLQVLQSGSYKQVGLNRWGLHKNPRPGVPYDIVPKSLKNGTKYMEINYKEQDRQKLQSMGVENYCKNGDFWSKEQPAWPLFSLNPSLNDTSFFKTLLPFDTDPVKNSKPVAYRFEMEFACKFLLKGGTKASMDTEYVTHMDGLSTQDL